MDKYEHKSWEVLNRRSVFTQEPWINLEIETVRVSDGRVIEDYFQLELPDFALVYAQTIGGKIITLKQYKHGVKRVSLTLPGGLIETNENPNDAIKRELLEETGYQAENWKFLGSYVVHGNLGCGQAHIYKAEKANKVQEPHSGDLEEMEILLLDPEELTAATTDGRIALLNHAAAISLAQQKAHVLNS